MQYACMPNIQIRDVPEGVHAALVKKAETAGQSLQQFLSADLTLWATRLTVEEVVAQIRERELGNFSARDALAVLDADRAGR